MPVCSRLSPLVSQPSFMSSHTASRKRSYEPEECDETDSEVEVLAVKKQKSSSDSNGRSVLKKSLDDFLKWMRNHVVMASFKDSVLAAFNFNMNNRREIASECDSPDDDEDSNISDENSKTKCLGRRFSTSVARQKENAFVTLPKSRNRLRRSQASDKSIATVVDLGVEDDVTPDPPLKWNSFTSANQSVRRQNLLHSTVMSGYKTPQHSAFLSDYRIPRLTSNGFGRLSSINHKFELSTKGNSHGDVIESGSIRRPPTPITEDSRLRFFTNGSRHGEARDDDIQFIGVSRSERSSNSSSKVPNRTQKSYGSLSRLSRNPLINGHSSFPFNSRLGRLTSSSSNSFTTNEVIRMQEKEQYGRLIQQFSYGNRYQVAVDKPESRNAETQINAEKDIDAAFTKERVDLSTNDLYAKYKNSCQLVKKTDSSETRKVQRQSSNTPKSIVVVPDNGTLGEDDDTPVVLDYKPTTPRSLPLPRQPSTFFTKEWLDDLKKTVEEESEERLKIVDEQEREIKEYKAKRAARLAELKRLEKLKISGPVLAEGVVIDKEANFPELTPEMETIIDNALLQTMPDEVLSKVNEYQVLRKDMDTLSGLNWLNDEVINFYLALIVERSKLDNYPSVYAFSSFFYPSLKTKGYSAVRRWTRKVDIFSYDINLVPLHFGVHWCLAVIDHRFKRLQFYDSMGGKDSCLETLHDYLMQECLDKKKKNFDGAVWALEKMTEIPPQLNGSDCGMFALKYAEYITRNAQITFTQQNMQYFRRRMVYEIMTRKLL